MTIESSLRQLTEAVASARKLVDLLDLALGDVPDGGCDPAVVDALRERTIDLQEHLERAEATLAGAGPREKNAAVCQSALNEAWWIVGSRLRAPDATDELELMRAEGAEAWRSWAEVVADRIDHCDYALYQAVTALAKHWTELSERRSSTSLKSL